MYDLRQWSFVADMNYSGSITISDVWLWIKSGYIFILVMGLFISLSISFLMLVIS